MTKDGFYFGNKHSYLIPYNEFSKKIMRNYDKIRTCMFAYLSKKHEVEYTNFRYMDFLVDNEMYLKIMLFLDINQIAALQTFIEINPNYLEKIYFICFEENAEHLQKLIKNCKFIIIQKSDIEEFLSSDYIEINGIKMHYPTNDYKQEIHIYTT